MLLANNGKGINRLFQQAFMGQERVTNPLEHALFYLVSKLLVSACYAH